MNRKQLLAELATYTERREGWDGDEALPASPKALSAAYTFVHSLPLRCPMPESTLHVTGLPELTWHNERGHLSVNFEDDGTASWLMQPVAEGTESISVPSLPPFLDAFPYAQEALGLLFNLLWLNPLAESAVDQLEEDAGGLEGPITKEGGEAGEITEGGWVVALEAAQNNEDGTV